MREEAEILGLFSGLHRETLYVWIERGWLAPGRGSDGYVFQEIDVARLRLIVEFRSELHRLADAVNAQPQDVQARISAHLEEN